MRLIAGKKKPDGEDGGGEVLRNKVGGPGNHQPIRIQRPGRKENRKSRAKPIDEVPRREGKLSRPRDLRGYCRGELDREHLERGKGAKEAAP